MPLPKVTPLELGRLAEPFDHPDWVFELKYDGFRAVLYLERGKARLVSRTGHLYTRFNDLCAALATEIKLREAIIDGEIVCLDRHGRPQFDQLFYRRGTPCFVAFDLLWLNGTDYRQRALLNRKSALSTVVSNGSACVLPAQYVLERGVALYREACRRDLEGIVAKYSLAPYAMVGKKSPWQKVRNPEYEQMKGRRDRFERLRGTVRSR